MSWYRNIQRLVRRPKARRQQRRESYRPLLEVLEDRTLPAALVPDGLVSWYQAENDAVDSADGHDGTLLPVVNGTTFSPGKVGQAFNFDGADDSVDLENWFTLQTFSLAMWVKPGATQVNFADILDNNHTDSQNWVIQYDNNTNALGQQYHYGAAEGVGGVTFRLTPDVWQFLAVTRDESNFNRVYLDGEQVATSQGTGPIAYSNQFLRIARWGGGGRNWNGQLDELLIYDRDLSADEIQTIYGNDEEPPPADCDPHPDVTTFNGHYYALTNGDGLTWEEAEAEAVACGGHLVAINDAAEQAFIESTFLAAEKASARPYWIGLTDKATEGTFVWSTAEPITYTNWKSGEPNDSDHLEDYGTVNWEYSRQDSPSAPKGTWNDTPLDGTKMFVANSDGPYRGIIEWNSNPDEEPTASPDLSMTMSDSPDPVLPGDNITYTIFVTNNDADEATPFTLTTAVPEHTTFVGFTAFAGGTSTTPPVGEMGDIISTKASLAPGDSATFTLIVKVGDETPNGTVIDVLAEVAGSEDDPDLDNNSAAAMTTVPTEPEEMVDLSILILDSLDPIVVGRDLWYTLVVADNGAFDADGVSVTTATPEHTTFQSITAPDGWSCETPAVNGTGNIMCTRPTLETNSDASFTLVVRVDTHAEHGTSLTGMASVSSDTPDSNADNNTKTVTTTVFGITASDIEELIETDTGTIDAVFKVRRAPSDQAASVDFRVNGLGGASSATENADFVPSSGTLTFDPGVTEIEVVVPVFGDLLDEGDEQFQLFLGRFNGPGFTVFSGARATIVDNDPVPTISIGDVSVSEGDSGQTEALFQIVASNPSGRRISGELQIHADTATNLALTPDFEAVCCIYEIPAEQTIGVYRVLINGDELFEENETFTITLTSAANAVIGDAGALGTILDDEYGLAINDVEVFEGHNGTTDAVFKVTFHRAPFGLTAEVDWETAPFDDFVNPFDARAGEDYRASSGHLVFGIADSTQEIRIPIYGDTVYESSHEFKVKLMNNEVAAIVDGEGVGRILNDDAPPVISISDASGDEGNSSDTVGRKRIRFNVHFEGKSQANPPLSYGIENGSALFGVDMASISLSHDGFENASIYVDILGDTVDEDNETFSVRLSSPNPDVVFADNTAVGTIIDDDPRPALYIGDATVAEDAPDGNVTLKVQLAGPTERTVRVSYYTSVGTAGTDDYFSSSGVVVFQPSEMEKNIIVTVKNDLADEPAEEFKIVLSDAVNATIGDSKGIVTITDNDQEPLLTINSIELFEGNSGTRNAVLTITLSQASGKTVKVGYRTVADSAIKGIDFTGKTGTVTFQPGETSKTITINIIGDTRREGTERFFVDLVDPENAKAFFGSRGTVSILDDDFTFANQSAQNAAASLPSPKKRRR